MDTRKKINCFIRLLAAMVLVFPLLTVSIASAASVQKFIITVTQPETGGKITPAAKNGQMQVIKGKNTTFTLQPGTGYHLSGVTIDGTAVYNGTTISDKNLTQVGKTKTYKYIFKAVTTDHSISASFAKDTYTLTVKTLSGTGTGSISASGLTCSGTTCTGVYEYKTSVTLAENPDANSVFDKWAGCKPDKTATTCTIIVTKNSNVTAKFKKGAGTTGGKGSALKLPEKISVVQAKKTSTKAPVPPADINVDYNKDKTFVFVKEQSMQSFDAINEILCSIAQSKYAEMLNKGDYKAQIDKTQCSSNNDNAANAGQQSQDQSSGSTAPSYDMWTLNSSRASDKAPEIVTAWIHKEQKMGPGGKQPLLINARLTMTEGVSDTNPYGLFVMNFIGYPVSLNGFPGADPVMKGFLKSEKDTQGQVILKFWNENTMSDPNNPKGSAPATFGFKAALKRTKDGNSGAGTLEGQEPGEQPGVLTKKTFNIEFNSDYFYRQDISSSNPEPVCLDRNKFIETVWRYGLYNPEGSRLNRNSGFPIKITQGAKDFFGWIGYWGLWCPNEVTVNNGDTVYKLNPGPPQGNTQPQPFTVLKANGRLHKHTRKTLKLGDVKNIPLQYNEMPPPSAPGTPPSPGKMYRVTWDGQKFYKDALMDQKTNMWSNIEPKQELDVTANVTIPELTFWSQSLGGSVRVKLDCKMPSPPAPGTPPPSPGTQVTFTCTAPADNSDIIFYAEDIVFPEATLPLTLRCYDNCPVPDSASGTVTTSMMKFDPMNPQDTTATDYAFDSNSMVLLYNDIPVVQTTTVTDPNNPQAQFGIMSGPLFDPNNPDNLAALKCPSNMMMNNTGQDTLCPWMAWSVLPVFYTWETGTNNWNQFTALIGNDGKPMKFQAPLPVQYIHIQPEPAAPDSKYNGSKFFMDYAGFGELHGIPGTCVDMATGQPVNCGPGTRWIPEFSIKAGAFVTDGTDNTKEYLVKPLEEEQQMIKIADTSVCSAALGTLQTFVLPDSKTWADPAIGAEPSVNGAPAVVGGVVQTSGQ